MNRQFDWPDLADLDARANRHRPTERAVICREVQRLHAELGLQPRDIANALGLNPADVIEMLVEGGT